jgi:RNA polymerase sigma-70 factor (ECF subfamily)
MTRSAVEIEELLDRLRSGDQQALAELFDRYRTSLRHMIALRLDQRLNGRVSPSDILQEAYIDALKRLHFYFEKPDLSFFGWLRLIVGQRLVDVHREHLGARMRNAGQEVSLHRGRGPAASSHCLAAHLVGHLTSPSQAALKREWCAQLEAALEGMDVLDREVLSLRHFEELSNSEVAEVLGIEKAAASKRYVRALARLKDILMNIPGFFDEHP